MKSSTKLALTDRAAERDIERRLVERLEEFLLELGEGFAFVAQQYLFEVDGDDFVIDLLLFNYVQNRFVIFELKKGRFRPDYAGQLGFYVAWADDKLRDPDRHDATVGILLCTARNDGVVHYALRSAAAPMAVSTFTYDTLPEAERDALPAANELLKAIDPPRVAGAPS